MISTINKYLDNAIKYFSIATSKEQDDINNILHNINNNILHQKEVNRLVKYSKRYKVITVANAMNTTSRLNKLYRKPLTIDNSDIV